MLVAELSSPLGRPKMKFMKLGTRPDAFVTKEAVRSVSSEVSTDLIIEVQNSVYHLHKFPLLSKCMLLRKLCSELKGSSEKAVIQLPDIPGGAEAFELCAKFCYGITVTLSALNIVPVRCAAEYLQMTDGVDQSNLIGKLEVFFKSCILRRWKDTLITLQSTKQFALQCEEIGITGQCIDAVAKSIIGRPSKLSPSSTTSSYKATSRDWWAEDIAELSIDHYWRIMVAVKSAGIVSNKLAGEAMRVYASRWLPNAAKHEHQIDPAADGSCSETLKELTTKHRLLLEKLVSLIPAEKGSVSCSFLLKLQKAANILNASAASKMELARRIGLQLEEASVDDLLIPSVSHSDQMLYDVDIVSTIMEEFMLQAQSPPTSPPRDRLRCERRRSRSAENVEFELQDNSRRSSSASHSSKLRVAKLIDGYLQEIAQDPNLPVEKLIALAEAVPDFARIDHDDLYRTIDTYLRAHPNLDKNGRKRLCRILDCKKLSVEVCMHASQNELLPLRVVVQVLFFEQSRTAMAGGQVAELPSNIRALLVRTAQGAGDKEALKLHRIGSATPMEDCWSISGLNSPSTKLSTLKMKLAEDDDGVDDVIPREVLLRSSSSRFKALCSLPNKPKRMLSKLWTVNRSLTESH